MEFRVGIGTLSASELEDAVTAGWTEITDSAMLQKRASDDGIDLSVFRGPCFFTFDDEPDGENFIVTATPPSPIAPATIVACLDFVLEYIRSSKGTQTVSKRADAA